MHPAAWTLSSLDDKAEATVLSSRRRWTIAGSGRQSRVTAAVPSRRPKNSRARERPESLALAGLCISPFTLGGMRLIAAIVCVALCASCTSNGDAARVTTVPHTRTAMSPATSQPASTTRAATSTSVLPSRRPPSVTAAPSGPIPADADNPAAVPAIADDPSTLGRQLVAAERTVRARAANGTQLLAAARTAQVAYRRIALHPRWDATVIALVPKSLRATVRANLRAQRELLAIRSPAPKGLLLAWSIRAAAPARELLGWYRRAGRRFGVEWQYLCAINLIETTFGKIHGLSISGAQGPMQFLPQTWAEFGGGGDVNNPHDAIFAAARYLAAHGFAGGDVDGALFAYDPTIHYANAVKAIVSVLLTDPRSFVGYYRWDVYYPTSSGVLLLPRGFNERRRTSAAAYARAHPRRVLR